MKSLYCILVGFVFLLSCEKEYVVSGEIINSLTRKPVSGIDIGYATIGKPSFGLNEPYVVYPVSYSPQTVTDENGRFDFTLLKGDYSRYVASGNILEYYKGQARINGQSSAFHAPGGYVTQPDGNFFKLASGFNITLSIEVDPKPLCRFDYPAIPATWAQYWCSIFMKDALSTTIYTNALLGLTEIKQKVFAVASEDQHAKGTFELTDGLGTTIKKIPFDVYCPVGDTTVIWLNW